MDTPWLILGAVILGLAFGLLGGWVAGQKSRSMGEGLILGILFGPLGVIVEGLLPTGSARPAAPARTSILRDELEPDQVDVDPIARAGRRLHKD